MNVWSWGVNMAKKAVSYLNHVQFSLVLIWFHNREGKVFSLKYFEPQYITFSVCRKRTSRSSHKQFFGFKGIHSSFEKKWLKECFWQSLPLSFQEIKTSRPTQKFQRVWITVILQKYFVILGFQWLALSHCDWIKVCHGEARNCCWLQELVLLQ